MTNNLKVEAEEFREAIDWMKDQKMCQIDVPMLPEITKLAEDVITLDMSMFSIFINSLLQGMQFGLIIADLRKERDELYKLEKLHAGPEN